MNPFPVTRREMLLAGGALYAGFSLGAGLSGAAAAGPPNIAHPDSLQPGQHIDSWIRLDRQGAVTVLTGKVELGQGIKTALLQIAADELCMAFDRLTIISGDTDMTPSEGVTAGSYSIKRSGGAIRTVAAQVRMLLLAEAAQRTGLKIDRLLARDGAIHTPDGQRYAYGDLISPAMLDRPVSLQAAVKDSSAYSIVNRSIPRIDIPAKVTGGSVYVQDLRLPGMLHARIVRPPRINARLVSIDRAAVMGLPGVLDLFRDGDFLAIVAREEHQAVSAMKTAAALARWETPPPPQFDNAPQIMMAQPARTSVVFERGNPSRSGSRKGRLSETYFRPYLAHGSIGPSCAVAQMVAGKLTIWTHSQAVFLLRKAVAEMLRMPIGQVRCIHCEGSGCYGHNGADDAAAEAAVLARAFSGRPVRVQWMRDQENMWEPFGSAMTAKIDATLGKSGSITDWTFDVWSHTHAGRPGRSLRGTPGGAGSLLVAGQISDPFDVPPAEEYSMLVVPEGSADRNAVPKYDIPNIRAVLHFLPENPVRVSALRAQGSHLNVFAIESAMDELAAMADIDPVEFRLRHLTDPRARAIVELAARNFGWRAGRRNPAGHGYGFAFAQYKNSAAYCAVALQVAVDRKTGVIRPIRVEATVDAGQVVNPDGLINQIEGGILQSLSWALYESVGFDGGQISSVDWQSYPVLRFDMVPEHVHVEIIDRPGTPFLGAGEASQGPATAALVNAVANATGFRPRSLPLIAENIAGATPIKASALNKGQK